MSPQPQACCQEPLPDMDAALGLGVRHGGGTLVVRALALAVTLMLPMVGAGAGLMYHSWSEREALRVAAYEATQAYEQLCAAPPLPPLPAAEAAHGRDVFLSTCGACHGPSGTGVRGLGKNLIESDFVAGRSDERMVAFLLVGRPTAKPIAMPPKGGRADLTEQDLRQVITYLRGLQDPRRMPALPAPVTTLAPASEAEKAQALAAAGGDAELAGYIANGTKLFNSTCIACHGPGGSGIPGNGKTLAGNEFIKSQKDDELLTFIKRGRDPSDPKNTTGVSMPPRGGNPALSDDDLLDIIAYLRTLQGGTATVSK